ncbi:MAG: hypothetical protein AcusKO_00710 [Acuticoccus sp.]
MVRAVALLGGSVNAGTMLTTDSVRTLMAAAPFWAVTLQPGFGTMATYGLSKLPGAEQRAAFERL